jgi:alginate O-acetyltransferase complex protein AlgI
LIFFFRLIFGFTQNPLFDFAVQNTFIENIFWLILAIILCCPIYVNVQNKMKSYFVNQINDAVNLILNITFFIISVCLLVGSTYNPFIYFRF